MKIKRNGTLCAVAYCNAFTLIVSHDWKDNVPEKVSLCKLFWQSLIGFFLKWPLSIGIICFLAVIAMIVFIVGSAGGLLVGRRFSFNNSASRFDATFVPIGRLNKFPPIAWMLSTFLTYDLWYFWANYSSIPPQVDGLHQSYWLFGAFVSIMVVFALGIILAALVVCGSILLISILLKYRRHYSWQISRPKPRRLNWSGLKPSNWEWLQMSKAYIKARKERICPMVEIIE